LLEALYVYYLQVAGFQPRTNLRYCLFLR